jgi:hypothetical protein
MDSDRRDDGDSLEGGQDWITLASEDTQSQLDSMASQYGTPCVTTTPTKTRSRITPMVRAHGVHTVNALAYAHCSLTPTT